MAQQKASFKKWWKNITGNKATKDLVDSIVYAGVPVHKTVGNQLRIQGYIPTIVSKCGWFLKENGLKTRGIFRVSGSAKRIADLQTLFDTPPLYGSQLDWTPYTMHDASSVLRRYLNSLPDPVITLEYYEKFREVHRTITDDKEKIAAYQDLMAKLPPPHSCLLMYLLDFLAMFAYHSDENLMTSKNLASVFQPGILSHPDHAMSPGDYMISASVVEFLIDNQSSFALPTPNFDEDDDESASFGVAQSATQYVNEPGPSAPVLPTLPMAQDLVNPVDDERIRRLLESTPTEDPGIAEGPSDDLLERSKSTSSVRRRLSLHKTIGAQPSVPGQRPTRSKSTSSSSSNHQGPPGLFTSNFLARRRSSRMSKTQSIYSVKGIEAEILPTPGADTATTGDKVAVHDTSLSSLIPEHLSIRKAHTFSHLPHTLDGIEADDTATKSKRAIVREPSIIFETIDLQFPLPSVPDSQLHADPTPSAVPKSTTNNENNETSNSPSAVAPNDHPPAPIHPLDNEQKPTSDKSARGRLAAMELTAHVHIPDPPLPQPEDLHSTHPRAFARHDPTHQRVSPLGASLLNNPTPGKTPVIPAAKENKRPSHRGDGPIQRTKSTPAGLVKSFGSRDGQDGHGHHSSGHNIWKGWLSGRQKDKSNKENEGGSGSHDDKKHDPSVLDKQRKYRSQEISSVLSSDEPYHASGAQNRRDSNRPGISAFIVREPIQEDAETGHDGVRKYNGVPPPRPKPPPPEGSLMDLLEPQSRPIFNSSHSGSTTPNGSRSASPSPQNRLPLPVDHSHTPSPPPSVHNSSKSRSNSLVGHHQDHHHRSRHGSRLQSHGSSASISSHGSGVAPSVAGGGDQHVYSSQVMSRSGELPGASSSLSGTIHSNHTSPNLSLYDHARMPGYSADFTTVTNPIPTPAKSRDRKPSMPYSSGLGSSSPSNRSRSNSFRTASPSRTQKTPSGSPRLTPASLPTAPQTPPPPIPLSRAESGRATPEGGWSPNRPQTPVRRGTAPASHYVHRPLHHPHPHGSPHSQQAHSHQHPHHHPSLLAGDDINLSRQHSSSSINTRPQGYQSPSLRAKSRERQREVQREREKEREREEDEFRLVQTRSATMGPHPVPQPGDPPGFF
ncbi:hypothetical protein BGW41_003924 [Actinomortierella wolfii]|nr:hypothetical protein BGW41_003924 [Actinomortierella wolfii]